MEIVTVAQATLHRIGSAQHRAFAGHPSKTVTREVSDDTPETLRELIITIAGENGESREALTELRLERHWGSPHDSLIFNIQVGSITYGQHYSECVTFPALKVGNRYFKLEEIKV